MTAPTTILTNSSIFAPWLCSGCVCGFYGLFLFTAELANHGIEGGREQKPERGHAEHAGEHRGAERLPHLGACACCDDERGNAENDRERGHQDWTEPRARGREGGFGWGGTFLLGLSREFHDQNRVLCRKANEDR